MAVEKLIRAYAENKYMRSLVQLIPNFGGAIDTLLYEKGSKWRQERLELLLKEFDERINKLVIENSLVRSDVENRIRSELFYDNFVRCVQESVETRDKIKIQSFANILTQLASESGFEDYEAELYINITHDITAYEICKLAFINKTSIEIYYSNQDKAIDILKYKDDITKNHKMDVDNNIPSDYDISEYELFSLYRLERQNLITRRIIEANGSLSVGWSTSMQSFSTMIFFKEKRIYEISKFGNSYCNWILNSNA